MVERTLKGAPLETLRSRTIDGIPIEPLYSFDQTPPPLDFDRAPRPLGRGWDIRVPVRHPDIDQATAEIRQALEGGAASVLCHLDPSGGNGVATGDAEDLARLLDSVLTDVAPVALDAGFHGPLAAEWLSRAAKASPAAPLCFHLDPLGAFARAGRSDGPIASHIVASADVGAGLAVPHPRASLFLASGAVVHEAGGGEAAEVAFAAACALAYARALEEKGVAPAEAFSRIVLGLAADGDPLVSIAKLRAARMIWRRITLACGVPCPAKIEVRSSRRMLTSADPWTNLVRITAAGFAAVVGGADAVVLGALTDALGLPAPFARRLARNTGLILMEEAHVGAVADPAGGAWAFEALSAALARAAWEKLQALEAAGGAAPALSAGLVGQWTTEGRRELEDGVRDGKRTIVGITAFRHGQDEAVEIEAAARASRPSPGVRLPGADSQCPALEPILLEDLAR
jgi:methylmalonyl-CoA mutase